MGGCLLCRKQTQLPDKIDKTRNNNNKNQNNQTSTDKLMSKSSTTTISSPEMPQLPSVTMDDFQPLKFLGKGSFGKVILVKYFKNNKTYAMKILKKEEIIRRKQIKHTKTERLLLEKLNHPFIAQLQFAFQDEKKLYFVTEFLQGGELYFHLRRNKNFKENSVKFYASQIFLAIDYMHKNGYIYRDLKLENILMDKDGYIKLTDFGLSKMIMNDMNIELKNTVCGTLEYMAPEMIKGDAYDKNVDWYSFGIVLYEMICGDFPFKLKNRKIEGSIYDEKIEFPETMSEEAKDIISKLLVVDPEKRLGYNNSDDIKNSLFFQNIDFDKMYKKEYRPPFRPKLYGELDLKYFDLNCTENNEELYDDDLIYNNNQNGVNNNENKDNNANENEKALLTKFEGFSYYKEEKDKLNTEEDEDDDDDFY